MEELIKGKAPLMNSSYMQLSARWATSHMEKVHCEDVA